jgi:Co/Zn/Cd efflux system component
MCLRLERCKERGMGKSCCQTPEPNQNPHNNPRWRAILWIALVANAAMFVVEIIAGVAADSRALQADALDFFADAANYAISLGVAGMALASRAKAALLKAATMLAFGLWVVGSALYGLIGGSNPEPQAMGMIGALALFVNVIVAVTIGKISLFANAENLLDVRQTKYDPLLLPQRAASGQWTVNAWAPLEGFILNGGIRLRFGGH